MLLRGRFCLVYSSLEHDPALVELGRIIRDADVPPSRSRRPESAGLDAFIRGLQLSVPDEHEKLILVRPLYDALYAYCQAKIQAPRPHQGAPRRGYGMASAWRPTSTNTSDPRSARREISEPARVRAL